MTSVEHDAPTTTDRQQLPRPVIAVIAAPFLIALAVALLAALATLTVDDAPARAAVTVFVAALSWLAGHGAHVDAFVPFLAAGEISVTLVPFGSMLATAVLLRFLPLTRTWLEREDTRWRGAGIGVAIALAVALFGGFVSLFADFENEVGSAEVSFGFSPVAILALGAGGWLLAHAAVQRRTVDRTVQLLGALTVLLVVVTALAALTGDGDGRFAALLLSVPATIASALNVITGLLMLPFLGAVSGDAGQLGGELTFGVLAKSSGWVWLLPLIAIAGFAAVGFLQPIATGWGDLMARAKVFALTAVSLLLPVAVLGDLTVRVSGQTAFGSEQLVSSIAVAGLPWRFVPALLVWTLAVLAGGWIAANRAGRDWATPERLAEAGAAAVDTTKGLVSSAQRAVTAAVAATQQSTATPGTAAPDPDAGATTERAEDLTTEDVAITQEDVVREATRLGVADQLPTLAAEAGVVTRSDAADGAKMRRLLQAVRDAGGEGVLDWEQR